MLIRSSYTNAVALEKEGEEWIVTGQIALKVFDGEFLYTVDQRHEGKTATKAYLKRGQFQYIGGRRLFSQVLGLDSFRLLPDETIDDKSAYVFEGKAADGTVTTQHYFDKQTGILLKMVTEDSLAQTKYTFALSDIKVNVEFDEDHFTFTPPEGMTVQDLTRRGAVKVPLPAEP
jgi:outer membrane lipoprotein-sorting protein